MDPLDDGLEFSEVVIEDNVMEIQSYSQSTIKDMNENLEPETEASAEGSIIRNGEKEGLNRNQKRLLSKLYRLGKKLAKNISNFEFQQEAQNLNLISQQFKFQKRGFMISKAKESQAKAKLHEASVVLQDGAKELSQHKNLNLKKKLKVQKTY
jgi:hypothetical protein